MDTPTDRERICERLAWIAEGFPFRRIVFGYADPVPGDRSGMVWPRLDVILAGTRDIALATPTGSALYHLEAGDAYYVLPNGWEAYQWNTAVQMLCVVPRTRFTRVSYYDQPLAVQPPPVPAYHHTDRPYGPAMRATIEALNALAWQPDTGAQADLARALIRLALDECRQPPSSQPPSKQQATFDRIRHWLDHCFAADINRETTARQFGITPSHLSRLFRDLAGVPFHQYLTDLRLGHARNLLRRTTLSIKEVGDQCGFPDPVHFCRRFRQAHGLAPGQYRNRPLD